MGALRYYKVKLLGGVDNVRVLMTPTEQRDLDLYASWQHFEPGSTADNYGLHCVDSGKTEIIINVENDDDNADNADDAEPAERTDRTRWLYIGVHAFKDAEHKENDTSVGRQRTRTPCAPMTAALARRLMRSVHRS